MTSAPKSIVNFRSLDFARDKLSIFDLKPVTESCLEISSGREQSATGNRQSKMPTGFTLVEAVVSMLIVGTMLVAAMSTIGASKLSQYKTSRHSGGHLLAELLMAEILRLDYQEPDGVVLFGTESGEAGATREAFDDVDDYHNWSSSPPTSKDGTVIPGMAGWRRSVIVEWVNPLNVTQVQDSETNAKRVTVMVSFNNERVTSLSAIKTASGL